MAIIYRENEKLAAFVKAHQSDPRLADITPKTVLDASTKSRATKDPEATAYLDKVWAIRAEILKEEKPDTSERFLHRPKIHRDDLDAIREGGAAERAAFRRVSGF